MTTSTIDVEESLRAQAQHTFESLGLDVSTAVSIFLRRAVAEGGLPFAMNMSGRIQHDGLRALRSANRSAEAAGLADMTLDEITRKIVEHSLAENNGNQSLTARRLGISRSTLWRMLGNAPGVPR